MEVQKIERPILFQTPMVQAILDGRKTQTRRIVKPQPDPESDAPVFMPVAPALNWEEHYNQEWKPWTFDTEDGETIMMHCPYGKPGDLLWVRETWRKYCHVDEFGYTHFDKEVIEFAADNPPMINLVDGDGFIEFNKDGSEKFVPWKPSIHMPKAAARIWLEVVSVRVERLQEITHEDAMAEGIEWKIKYPEEAPGVKYYRDYMFKDRFAQGIGFKPMQSFKSLWEKINGLESWIANPWVWVIEFKVLSTTGKPTN